MKKGKTDKIIIGLFIALVILLFAVSFVKAEDNSTDDQEDKIINTDALNVRLEHLQCKVDLSKTQVDLIDKYLNVSLSTKLDKVIADMLNLKDLKDNGNKTAFDAFVEQTFRPDFQNITQELNTLKKNWKSYNLSNDTQAAFKNDFKNAQATYANCVGDKEEKMANISERHYKNSEKKWNNIIGDMQKRNMTVDQMLNITQEMQAQLQKLEDALRSKNDTLIKQALEDIRQAHLHLWARFNTARLEGYIEKMTPMANKYGKSEQVRMMKKQLDDLSNYTMPGRKYDDGDLKRVWGQLSNTSKDMRDTAKDMLKQQQDERKQLRGAANQKIGDRQGRGPNRSGGGNQQ